MLALLIGSDRSTEPFIIIFYSKLRQGTLLYFGNGHRKFAGSICRNSLRAWSGRLLAKAQISNPEHAMAAPVISFQQIISECEAQGLSSSNCGRIAVEMARTFGVFDDEVAILRVVNNNYLTFIYPEKLTQVGIIPMNNSSAVAARTALSRRPEVLNNFAQIKHASIFEAVPVQSKTRPAPPEKSASVIQKIMTAPVLGQKGVLGVIQVSRKGLTPQAAGRDFTPGDLQKLISMTQILAKCFK